MSTKAQEKPKVLLIEPYWKSNSDRMLESTKNSPNKVYLNAPEQMGISNTSFIQTKENGVVKRRATRWYLGCTTIFLDEQLKFERENNMEKKILGVQDTIFIKNGILELEWSQKDANLYDFLKTHNDNTSNPNRVAPEAGEDFTAFKEINTEADAKADIAQIDKREIAIEILNKTRIKIGATREFNENYLGKLKAIFGIDSNVSSAESYTSLYEFAYQNPDAFVAKVDQNRTNIVTQFKAAQEAKAISYDNGKYLINDKVVFTATEKEPKKQDAEFLEFISEERGFQVFQDMLTQTNINQLTVK